jgi:hypothetical protein
MRRALIHRGSVAALVLASMCGAAGANEIRSQCLGLGMVIVADGGAADLDAAPNRIRTNFNCLVVGGAFSWRAKGTLIGIADPPFSSEASTRLINFKVENLAGNVGGQLFTFQHRFGQLGPPMPGTSAVVNGRFDSVTTPGNLGGARLDVWSHVSGPAGTALVDTGGTPHVAGAAPIPFGFAGGPVAIVHPNRHSGMMLFYLDTPGDAILMTGAGGWQINSTAAIPEPGSLALLGLAAAGGVRRRRPGLG